MIRRLGVVFHIIGFLFFGAGIWVAYVADGGATRLYDFKPFVGVALVSGVPFMIGWIISGLKPWEIWD